MQKVDNSQIWQQLQSGRKIAHYSEGQENRSPWSSSRLGLFEKFTIQWGFVNQLCFGSHWLSPLPNDRKWDGN